MTITFGTPVIHTTTNGQTLSDSSFTIAVGDYVLILGGDDSGSNPTVTSSLGTITAIETDYMVVCYYVYNGTTSSINPTITYTASSGSSDIVFSLVSVTGSSGITLIDALSGGTSPSASASITPNSVLVLFLGDENDAMPTSSDTVLVSENLTGGLNDIEIFAVYNTNTSSSNASVGVSATTSVLYNYIVFEVEAAASGSTASGSAAISDTVSLISSQAVGGSAAISDSISSIVSALAAGSISVSDAVSFIVSGLASGSVSLSDAVSFVINNAANGAVNGIVSIADAISFLTSAHLAMSEDISFLSSLIMSEKSSISSGSSTSLSFKISANFETPESINTSISFVKSQAYSSSGNITASPSFVISQVLNLYEYFQSSEEQRTVQQTFYQALEAFLESKGITPISLIKDIKAIGYYYSSPYVIIPKNLSVEAVWNGYLYTYDFDMIVASLNEKTFRTMKSNVQRLIGQNLYYGQVVIVYSNYQKLDIMVKGFYRETYGFKITFFIPFS